MKPQNIRGFLIYKNYLTKTDQRDIRTDIRQVTKKAPMFSLSTARGKRMSVRMSSAGKYGWYSDHRGYRYEPSHPVGGAWPPIPESVLKVWRSVAQSERLPDCCLVNYYDEFARMGLHQDKDEADFSYPVVSISLGDSGLFRVGGPERKDSTESLWLESGDVCVMGGKARLYYHGIDRIRFGSSKLLKNGGRLNLTLRVVE